MWSNSGTPLSHDGSKPHSYVDDYKCSWTNKQPVLLEHPFQCDVCWIMQGDAPSKHLRCSVNQRRKQARTAQATEILKPDSENAKGKSRTGIREHKNSETRFANRVRKFGNREQPSQEQNDRNCVDLICTLRPCLCQVTNARPQNRQRFFCCQNKR